jgi:hypothetical protein
VRLSAPRLPVVIGQCQRRRDADEERRDRIIVAVLIDGDDGGCRLAIHEAREQGEVGVIARDERLEHGAVIGGDIRAPSRPAPAPRRPAPRRSSWRAHPACPHGYSRCVPRATPRLSPCASLRKCRRGCRQIGTFFSVVVAEPATAPEALGPFLFRASPGSSRRSGRYEPPREPTLQFASGSAEISAVSRVVANDRC